MTRSIARRRGATLAVLTAAALALTACSGTAEPTPTPSTVYQDPTIEPDKQPVPTPSVEATWPLTGVAGDPVERPSLAVKVENTSAARPQSGLEQADIVWETIVEFQVSRFIAVFQSQVPEEVGPVRSVRPMDPVILEPTKGLLAFSGGQEGIVALAKASGLQLFSNDWGSPGMYRSSDRAAPHNVYLTPQTLWDNADANHSAAPGEQFLFARSADKAAPAAGGSAAGTLTFNLSAAARPVWTWDAGTSTWLRSEGSSPATARSGDRLSAVNVVAIVAEHPNTKFPAQGGARVPTYNLVGTGTGLIATGGKTIPVTWKKTAEDQPLRLFLADGSPALLSPGNTWVELVPKETGSFTVS
ncbi:DUF3048 domain-containing protein [Cellulomonas composti]|uniref:Lipoprotein YerB n=1 Tax=Cellulomonas composti TaxID=266130 RepID=A0A511JF04_9CELL|nr:DUF3048 domain-containing protein [Cellulomonas composti]GEL96379.1 hypothetical protein CCO02nite_30370 [Cellulomonas composti]